MPSGISQRSRSMWRSPATKSISPAAAMASGTSAAPGNVWAGSFPGAQDAAVAAGARLIAVRMAATKISRAMISRCKASGIARLKARPEERRPVVPGPPPVRPAGQRPLLFARGRVAAVLLTTAGLLRAAGGLDRVAAGPVSTLAAAAGAFFAAISASFHRDE